ncbi:MAG: hypothetical protein AAGJ46_13585 [Planctomycetota bacterium]
MRRHSALAFAVILFASAGCGPQIDKEPLLTSLGAIAVNMNEIADKLDDGDLEAVDGVMHREDFGKPFNLLKMQAAKSGLDQAAQDAVLEVQSKLQAALAVIHEQAHGGSIDNLDVPTIVSNIRGALSDLQAAMPTGYAIPTEVTVAVAEDAHDEDAHDHDHDGGDHGHDHEGQGHDKDSDEHSGKEHAGEDGDAKE